MKANQGRFRKVVSEFFAAESASGIVLVGCALVAIVWANSAYSESYAAFLHLPISFQIGNFLLEQDLHEFINDGLMAIFFFVVGLEIKREILVGELSSKKQALLPVAAALGGMLVPAAIYAAFNSGGAGAAGWGVPMATDIAFSLAVLTLVSSRVPFGLKIFLTALAIVDDLGAVVVIALFYTKDIAFNYLAIAALILALLIVCNRRGVRSIGMYLIAGLVIWYLFLRSGVHATVAGVLLALTVPLNRAIGVEQYVKESRTIFGRFDLRNTSPHALTSQQKHDLEQASHLNEEFESILEKFIHGLHPWVAFLIMPLFALANSGVVIQGSFADALAHPITLGIALGLLVGKPLGITLFSWLAVKGGFASLPAGADFKKVFAVACVAGIGFTMSLFIASLAFGSGELDQIAKVGILTGSIVSSLLGVALLLREPKLIKH